MFIHEYLVEDANQITVSTLLLTLKSRHGTALSFQPGQYAAISFTSKLRPTPARCFSIVSSPTQQSTLQFAMRTKGHFTKALTRLKPGDIVKVRGPFGGFVLNTELNKDIVLLAGGIGITPFISMVRFATEINSNNKIHLIYGCQSQDDIPFFEELLDLQDKNPNLKVIFVVADGPTDKIPKHNVRTGRITTDIINEAIASNHNNKQFYICGPPPFMKGLTSSLSSMGVAGKDILTEAFSQSSSRQTGRIQSWPYNMYALSAVGVTMGSFLIMANDFIENMPPKTLLDNPGKSTKTNILTNSRQQDLDKLVNQLPNLDATAPASSAVTAALAQLAEAQAQTNGQVGSAQPTTTTPTSSNPTPTPAPTPVCTTTPSGVKVC